MTWTTRGSRTVYENRWISVREDQVTGPAGDGVYGVVTMQHPAVFIVAVDDAERVCLVRLDRYTTGTGWEVPAGGTDGEEPEIAARRELREETGLVATEWAMIGRMNALNGIAEAPEYVFLARGVRAVADDGAEQALEGIDAVRWAPLPDVLAMVRDGEISDGESVAALLYALIHLRPELLAR